MRVNRFADIYGVCTHLDGLGDFTNHVTPMCADHATEVENMGTLARICMLTLMKPRSVSVKSAF